MPDSSVVMIGDIGVLDGMLHVGDEAMFEAMVHSLRARGATGITALSSNPDDSRERYGVDALAPIGFARTGDGAGEWMRARMASVAAATRGETSALTAGDPAFAVIEAIRASSGVVVAGGGNLASRWPLHIFERATLAAIADQLGKPFVVSGQTLGPDISASDRPVLDRMLRSARLVGVREPSSWAFAHSLELPDGLVTQTIDDASFLVDEQPPAPGGYCLVTLSTWFGVHDSEAFIPRVAELLDAVAARGLEVRFLAHFGEVDGGQERGDSVVHRRVAERMDAASTLLPTVDARASSRLARGATLVVTSRYHPAIFAVPAGVPTLALPVDDYTTVKLSGALVNFGQSGLLPAERLLAGEGVGFASHLLEEAENIREHAALLLPAKRAASGVWFDRVAALTT